MTIFAKEEKPQSLAGKWGDERRKNIGAMREEMHRAHFTTEYKLRFSEPPLEAQRNLTSSPMNKFKTMQRNGFSLTSLQNPPESVDNTGGNSRPSTSGAMGVSNSGRLSPPRPSSPSSSTNPRGSLNDDHRAATAPAGPPRSIYKETYINHFVPPEVLQDSEKNSLHRSNSRNMHSVHAPIAVGRSGLRKERGCMTSGLSGERLMNTSEPRFNSFAQRAWLYNDDPALKTKVQGRPPVARVMDRSLILPTENEELKEEEQIASKRQLNTTLASSKTSIYDESLLSQIEENEKKAHIHYGRHYVYTGDVISRTGARRYGVFLDEHDDEVLKSVPVFRR